MTFNAIELGGSWRAAHFSHLPVVFDNEVVRCSQVQMSKSVEWLDNS
jgi:hypothetical protein